MKKMSKGLLMTALICGTMNLTAYAQAAEPQEFVLDEYVVTASRTETKKVDTPANISVITAEDLADHNYSSAAEALADTPGVNVLGSGAKGSSMGQDKILINGDERVLVLIDGRRTNLGSSGNYSADWLPSVNAIERIEVLKGGGSALYGTDAVGGVINIITKKGSDIDNKVTVRAVGGSWNTEQYGISAGGSNEHGLGIFVSANKERRGDYDYEGAGGEKNTLKNSGYNNTNVNLKLDQAVGEDNRVTFSYEHVNAKGGSPFGYYGFGETDNHERLNNNVALRYDWNETSDQAGYVQVYRNYQHSEFLSPDVDNQSDYTDMTTGFEAQQNYKFNDNNELTTGIEYYKTEVDNQGFYGQERSIDNKAIFMEDRWKFADSWQLNTGLRYDKHSEYGSEVTPKIALNKKLNDDSNVYLSWGKVFNAPTTDDLYWNQAGLYGNPNLEPETGDVWTLGGNVKVSEKTELSASVFYSEIDDAIDWQATGHGWDMQVVNVNKEKRRGMEISVNHDFDENFSAYASYTYVQVKQDRGSGFAKDLKAQPNIYRIGASYKNELWRFNVDLNAVSGLSEKEFVENNYLTLDVGAQYKINDDAKLFVNCYNLTDERYAEYGGLYSDGGARYPMASRHFIAGVEYSF